MCLKIIVQDTFIGDGVFALSIILSPCGLNKMIIRLTLFLFPSCEHYELNVCMFLARPKAWRDSSRRSRIGAGHATILSC